MRTMAALLLVLTLASCNNWESEKAVDSPDGRIRALIEYKNSAACCSDQSRLKLLNIVEGTLIDPGIVAEVEGAHLNARWETNDQLIVTACGATRYDVHARSLREGVFRADGSENAVSIEIVSMPNTVRNGVSICPAADS